MRLGFFLLLWLAQAAAALAPVPDEVLAAAERDGHARVIVRLAAAEAPPGRRETAAERAARGLSIQGTAARVLSRLATPAATAARSYDALPFLALDASPAELRRLASDAEVLGIEEDRRMSLLLLESVPWLGADIAHTAGYDGSGWAVAVLDSGIDAGHYFFTGRVVEEACFSAGRDCPNGKTTQYGPGSAVPCDYASTCFHGTHVGGIATGSFGVAPGVDILSMQVSSEQTGTACGGTSPCIVIYTSDAVAALDYVVTLSASYPIAAVNMSFGTGTTWSSESACNAANTAFKSAIDSVTALGIAVVAASGNANVTSGIDAPACISSAIGVAATYDSSDNVWISSSTLGSNTGPPLDFFAPGSPITSAYPYATVTTRSGTSMAAPHVTGTYALMRQADPTASLASLTATLAGTGVSVTDTRNGLTRPRIVVDDAVRGRAPAQCFDGIDNDGDGYVDVDGNGGAPDPDCVDGFDNQEQLVVPPACGLGPELALGVPLLALARRRNRKAR